MKKEFRTKNLLSEFVLDPGFVVEGDLVLLSRTESDEQIELRERLGLERWRIEMILNTRWAYELFVNRPEELSRRTAIQACQTIRDIWRSKLKLKFPDRSFFVMLDYDGPPYDIMSVSFCQLEGAPEWLISAMNRDKKHT